MNAEGIVGAKCPGIDALHFGPKVAPPISIDRGPRAITPGEEITWGRPREYFRADKTHPAPHARNQSQSTLV